MILEMENQVINSYPPESLPSADKLSTTKSIYEVSAGEIFWRNLLAGASRALGSLIIYALFLLLMLTIISRTVLPVIMPLLEKSFAAMESLENSQKALQGLSGTDGSAAFIQQLEMDPGLMRQLEQFSGSSPTQIQNAVPSY